MNHSLFTKLMHRQKYTTAPITGTGNATARVSFLIQLCVLLSYILIIQAFTFVRPYSTNINHMMTYQSLQLQEGEQILKSNRKMLTTMLHARLDHDSDDTVSVSRRKVLSNVKQSLVVVPFVVVMIQSWQPLSTLPVYALDDETSSTSTNDDETIIQLNQLKTDIQNGFQLVRNELLNDTGGIKVLQQYMNNKDYNSILEYTKTYDQIIRKGMIGKTKKLIVQYIKLNNSNDSKISEQQSKIYNDRIIQISNDITFDLIGMNRNARIGQESIINLNQYLNNLQNDLQDFLKIESEIF